MSIEDLNQRNYSLTESEKENLSAEELEKTEANITSANDKITKDKPEKDINEALEEISNEEFLQKYELNDVFEKYRESIGANFKELETKIIEDLKDFVSKRKFLTEEEQEILKKDGLPSKAEKLIKSLFQEAA